VYLASERSCKAVGVSECLILTEKAHAFLRYREGKPILILSNHQMPDRGVFSNRLECTLHCPHRNTFELEL
jgi:hypothetical protein